MAQQQPAQDAPHQVEKTFRSYNEDQAEMYAQARVQYSPEVYKYILDTHTSTGGQTSLLIDIGCGPGLATRPLAPHFKTVYGLDPSEGMIAKARQLPNPDNIHFEISTAEELGTNLPGDLKVQDSTVDLITAANAAHWFNMPEFWRTAAKISKPGGSVILWTSGTAVAHPDMPNSAKIQEVFDWHYETYLKPYLTPGNLLARERYIDLPLPWSIATPIPDFDEATFVRKDWGLEETSAFHTGVPPEGISLDMFEKITSTGSPVTRWRQAHPELVGTEEDILRVMRRKMEGLLHEAGVKEGEERVKGVMQGVVLVVKKKG